jgi:hypothetical protein
MGNGQRQVHVEQAEVPRKIADIVEPGTLPSQESAKGNGGPLTHICGDACFCKEKALVPHRLRERCLHRELEDNNKIIRR